MTLGVGSTNAYLDEGAVREIVATAVHTIPVQGKRALIIIPDGTRTAPIPQMFHCFQELLQP